MLGEAGELGYQGEPGYPGPQVVSRAVFLIKIFIIYFFIYISKVIPLPKSILLSSIQGLLSIKICCIINL